LALIRTDHELLLSGLKLTSTAHPDLNPQINSAPTPSNPHPPSTANSPSIGHYSTLQPHHAPKKMPPKQRNPSNPLGTSTMSSHSSSSHTTTKSSSTTTTSTTRSSTKSTIDPHNASDVLQTIWTRYQSQTPQRVKLLDSFMGFLVAVGVLQFVYCVIVGNFPFNAFLSGFSATVGQFVLTASLRIQTNPENKKEFGSISHERAFADFVLGSMLLHFFCVNFIN
jgi:oligosaccharyltransferase complex subunit epsilon